MKRDTKILLWFAFGALVLGSALFGNREADKQAAIETEQAAKPKEPNTADAYGMCCQAIRNAFPSAEHFKVSPNECVDYGTGVWIIVGYADIMERRVRWTAEIKHNADDTWQLTETPAFMDIGQGER